MAKLIEKAREAYSRADEAWYENLRIAEDDYIFARLGEQWPENVRKEREVEGRPCHTINKLPAFIRQVTNDARQNRPQIRVHPIDDNADVDTADILNGLIRNIEYTSDADASYDTALDQAASMGFGYWRVNVDFADDDVFEKDILIERIMDGRCVLPDPNSTSTDSSDWDECFVTEWVTEAEFEERYPDAERIDWDAGHRTSDKWYQGDMVLLAEWWTRERVNTKLFRLTNGEVMLEEDWERHREFYEAEGIGVAEERPTRSHKVMQRILNGQEVLEEIEWAGKYIPIVPCYGEEVLDDRGGRMFLGLVHFAREPQEIYNYWRTASTELVALAPKSPWVGEEGAFDVDERWETANKVNYAYLVHKKGSPPPERQQFADVPVGAMQEALNANDDMKGVLGMFDASLGQASNEVSGIAINARKQEGDVSTFHFIDNLSRAIRHTGRILVDLIPKVYTTPRIVRILGEDGEPQSVPVNQEVEVEGQPRVFDLTIGKYDVAVKAGPSFTTRRMEASEQMMDLVKTFPQAAPIIGDLIAKNLDWPGADEIAKRLKTLLPAEISGEEDPRLAEMNQQIQGLTAQLQAVMADKSLEERKIAIDEFEASVKQYEAETERMEALAKVEKGKMDAFLKSFETGFKANPSSAPGTRPGGPGFPGNF